MILRTPPVLVAFAVVQEIVATSTVSKWMRSSPVSLITNTVHDPGFDSYSPDRISSLREDSLSSTNGLIPARWYSGEPVFLVASLIEKDSCHSNGCAVEVQSIACPFPIISLFNGVISNSTSTGFTSVTAQEKNVLDEQDLTLIPKFDGLFSKIQRINMESQEFSAIFVQCDLQVECILYDYQGVIVCAEGLENSPPFISESANCVDEKDNDYLPWRLNTLSCGFMLICFAYLCGWAQILYSVSVNCWITTTIFSQKKESPYPTGKAEVASTFLKKSRIRSLVVMVLCADRVGAWSLPHGVWHQHTYLFSSDLKQETLSGNLSFSYDETDWVVYVDYSKQSLEKGAAATLDAFLSLVPAQRVQVKAAFLPRQSKSGAQPWVRCVSLRKENAIEIFGVDSVDKVYRVLTKHMGLEGISRRSCRCLQYKYKANGFLEAGKVDLAIEAYQKSLQSAAGDRQQEGVILFLRAAAYLQRAAQHRDYLRATVDELTEMVPSPQRLVLLLDVARYASPLSAAIFRRILADADRQERHFRITQYRHGLYQYALLQAAQDALKATEVLPDYAAAWSRAGDILGELWRLPEAILYYEHAMELDSSLRPSLMPIVARLERRRELLSEAKTYRWSKDALRLALDVAS